MSSKPETRNQKPEIRNPLFRALLGLLVFMLPLVALGPRSFVLLHDCLDSEVAWCWLLVKTHLAQAGPGRVLPQLMDGLPRDAMRSGLSMTVWIFQLLPDSPLLAYLLHEVLARTAGLLGMYWLLRRYGLADERQRGLAAAVALLWACLPAYSIFGLTVLGQPLLLRVALNLRRGAGTWVDYLTCALLPFWSSLVLMGPFVAVVWGLALLADLGRRGRVAGPAVGRGSAGLALLLAGYAVVEWRLLLSVLLHPGFVAHRQEFNLARLRAVGLAASLREAGRLFWLGQYHASGFFTGGIAAALAVVLGRLGGAARRQLAGQAAGLLAVVAGLCGLAALGPLLGLALHQLPLLHAFTLDRFYFLLALPWLLVLVLAVRRLPPARLAYALVLGQLPLLLAANPEMVNNLRALAGRPRPDAPGYQAFVARRLLGQVQGFIESRAGQPASAYRVACLGLPPAVAQYNGFYTLDAYQTLYPLTYKHAFRGISAGELAKSPALAAYFDAWGNRCYVASAELGRSYLVGKQPARSVQDFQFGTAAFRQLGGRYLLSAVRLEHPAATGLRLLGVFDSPEAYWRIYLYEAAE